MAGGVTPSLVQKIAPARTVVGHGPDFVSVSAPGRKDRAAGGASGVRTWRGSASSWPAAPGMSPARAQGSCVRGFILGGDADGER